MWFQDFVRANCSIRHFLLGNSQWFRLEIYGMTVAILFVCKLVAFFSYSFSFSFSTIFIHQYYKLMEMINITCRWNRNTIEREKITGMIVKKLCQYLQILSRLLLHYEWKCVCWVATSSASTIFFVPADLSKTSHFRTSCHENKSSFIFRDENSITNCIL